MSLNLRKTIVGLSVLVVLLAAYVAYSRLGGNAPIRNHEVPKPGPNDVVRISAEEAGRVNPTTAVGPIRNTRLIHTNAGGRIDRVFGFDYLSHGQGKQWEATRPFMTMRESGFQCSVTADRAQVQIESDSGRFIPNDAMFSGHVVIHIASIEPNEMKEAFIYLDDVMFTAEKSLFSTAGPVRFVSHNAQLTGRGLDLLYDEQRERLELFSIRQLDSLRLRSEAFRELSDASRGPAKDSSAKSVKSAKGGAASGPDSKAASTASADPRMVAYECIFWDDARVTTPEQILRALERLAITNLLWPAGGSEKSDQAKADSGKVAGKPKAEPNEPDSLTLAENPGMKTTGSNAVAFESLPESLFDTVITCKGGLVIRPMGTTLPAAAGPKKSSVETTVDSEVLDDPLHEIILARRIDFDASTRDAVLPGPVRMLLHVDPNFAADSGHGDQRIPATIYARKEARLFSDSNQVVLDGDCMLTMRETDPNFTTETRLTMPMLSLDLILDANSAGKKAVAGSHAWGPALNLRHAVTSGGAAALQVLRKTTAGQVVGGVELQGKQFDYENQQKHLAVTGPGQMSLYNARVAGAKADSNEFSLRQPCWAFLRDFDRLTYSKDPNRIVAESKAKQLQIDYFPLANDGTERHIQADVGHIEIDLSETADNRTELAALTASDGIIFQDRVKRPEGSTVSQFDGSTLFYDYRKGVMTIGGDKNRPCYFNGTPVDEIEMNVKTHQAKAKFIAPSTIHVK